MLEGKGPVVFGWNDNLSVSIGESVFLIDNRANQPLRELLSPIVVRRNGSYDNAPFSIDVHPPLPGVILIEYRRQAVRIECQFFDIFLRDKQLPLTVLQNTVWMTINVVSLSKVATIACTWGRHCNTFARRLRFRCLSRARVLEQQEAGQDDAWQECTHEIYRNILSRVRVRGQTSLGLLY